MHKKPKKVIKHKKNLIKVFGIISILIGIFFILNSLAGITGFIIAGSIIKDSGGIIGLIFVIVGVVIFMSEKNLEKTIGAPTNAQIKAIEKMEKGLKSGKKYKPQEAKSLLNQAGYELIPTKGDHMKILREDKPVRNLPTNPRPNSFMELDMSSKSHNPEKVLKTIVYDFKNRQFKDYYFD